MNTTRQKNRVGLAPYLAKSTTGTPRSQGGCALPEREGVPPGASEDGRKGRFRHLFDGAEDPSCASLIASGGVFSERSEPSAIDGIDLRLTQQGGATTAPREGVACAKYGGRRALAATVFIENSRSAIVAPFMRRYNICRFNICTAIFRACKYGICTRCTEGWQEVALSSVERLDCNYFTEEESTCWYSTGSVAKPVCDRARGDPIALTADC